MEELVLLNQIASLLQQKGYNPTAVNGRTGSYIKETAEEIFLIVLCAYHSDDSYSSYEKLAQGAKFNAVTKYKQRVNSLLLIVNRDGIFDDTLTDVAAKLDGVWLLAADTGKIYVYENQPMEFDFDLHDYLEKNLFRNQHDLVKDVPFTLTPVNISIVVLNIITFIIVIFINGNLFASYDANTMLKMGALSYNSFFDGRWYEIITSMFLHFGISHLFNNMLLLTYIGCELEKRVGSIIYLVVYLISGIVGNAASLWYYSRIGDLDVVSAGASGAIFGVMGCLAVFLLVTPSKNRNLTTRRLLIMALLTIYYGLTGVGIDNAAHIGGFCFGLFGGFLLSKIFHYDKMSKGVDFVLAQKINTFANEDTESTDDVIK